MNMMKRDSELATTTAFSKFASRVINWPWVLYLVWLLVLVLMCFGMLGSWLDTNNCYHSRAKYIIVNLERWHDVFVFVFTRGQFWPSGIVVACVCLCTCVCINLLFVRAITRDPLKLGSPNLDQRCKRLGYGPYCFGGKLTFTFKVKFNIKVRIYPILSLSAP